ncbi:phage baseplate assembly protein V [Acinetobacter sp. B5B]|uniref:phage baseplate assembly protein V n=1 Tax=Acinetobacter baretiae TaxID=2605383 RepID=UPI0018C30876|nr:phage baseplate assembly protein V [Acinetobacter baretiae]MBF7683861.1 phage baseplate assembly protein V [Acinetobacter baretiae]
MNIETLRRLENMIRFGRIKTVQANKPSPTVTVNLGDIVTKPLRLLNLRAGKDLTHDLPSIHEECIVFSPSGVLEAGVVFVGLNNDDFPAPSNDPAIKLRLYEDGALISYDVKNHSLQAILPKGATAILTADGGLTINGDTTINGNLTTNGDVKTIGNTTMTGNNTVGGSQSVTGTSQSTGSISTSGDVTASGISLQNHKHNGIKSGTDTSGGPTS